ADVGAGSARRLGQAFGTLAAERGAPLVAVGRDCRLTSDGYAAALVEGVRAAGIDVLDVGMCPTPLLYFAIFHWRLGGGLQVTGSHNPPDYNGFKLCLGTEARHGDDIQALRLRVESGPLRPAAGAVEARPVIR